MLDKANKPCATIDGINRKAIGLKHALFTLHKTCCIRVVTDTRKPFRRACFFCEGMLIYIVTTLITLLE